MIDIIVKDEQIKGLVEYTLNRLSERFKVILENNMESIGGFEHVRERNLVVIDKPAFSVRIVGVDVPYARYVEFGTRPHMPPVEPLIRWAKRKFKVDDEEAKKIGWSVAMTIKKKGTKPHPFFRKSIAEFIDGGGKL